MAESTSQCIVLVQKLQVNQLLSGGGSHATGTRLIVEILVNGKVVRSTAEAALKSPNGNWNWQPNLRIPGELKKFTIRVVHCRSLVKNKPLGIVEIEFNELIDKYYPSSSTEVNKRLIATNPGPLLDITLGYSVDGLDNQAMYEVSTDSSSDRLQYTDSFPPIRDTTKNQSLTSLSSSNTVRSESSSVPYSASAISVPESRFDGKSSQVQSFTGDAEVERINFKRRSLSQPIAVAVVQSESSVNPGNNSMPVTASTTDHRTHVSRAALPMQHTHSLPDYHQQQGATQPTPAVSHLRSESVSNIPAQPTVRAVASAISNDTTPSEWTAFESQFSHATTQGQTRPSAAETTSQITSPVSESTDSLENDFRAGAAQVPSNTLSLARAGQSLSELQHKSPPQVPAQPSQRRSDYVVTATKEQQVLAPQTRQSESHSEVQPTATSQASQNASSQVYNNRQQSDLAQQQNQQLVNSRADDNQRSQEKDGLIRIESKQQTAQEVTSMPKELSEKSPSQHQIQPNFTEDHGKSSIPASHSVAAGIRGTDNFENSANATAEITQRTLVQPNVGNIVESSPHTSNYTSSIQNNSKSSISTTPKPTYATAGIATSVTPTSQYDLSANTRIDSTQQDGTKDATPKLPNISRNNSNAELEERRLGVNTSSAQRSGFRHAYIPREVFGEFTVEMTEIQPEAPSLASHNTEVLPKETAKNPQLVAHDSSQKENQSVPSLNSARVETKSDTQAIGIGSSLPAKSVQEQIPLTTTPHRSIPETEKSVTLPADTSSAESKLGPTANHASTPLQQSKYPSAQENRVTQGVPSNVGLLSAKAEQRQTSNNADQLGDSSNTIRTLVKQSSQLALPGSYGVKSKDIAVVSVLRDDRDIPPKKDDQLNSRSSPPTAALLAQQHEIQREKQGASSFAQEKSIITETNVSADLDARGTRRDVPAFKTSLPEQHEKSTSDQINKSESAEQSANVEISRNPVLAPAAKDKDLRSALEHLSILTADAAQSTVDAVSAPAELLETPAETAAGLTTSITISEMPSTSTTLVQSPPLSLSNSLSSTSSYVNSSPLINPSILGPPESLSRPITPSLEGKRHGINVSSIFTSSAKVADLKEKGIELGNAVAPVMNAIMQNSDVSQLLSGALQVMNRFVQVADSLKKAHPILDVSISILTVAFKLIRTQTTQDQSIRHLSLVMNDMLACAQGVVEVANFEHLQRVIDRMFNEIRNCGEFMQTYFHRGFWGRTARLAVSSYSTEMIERFERSFTDLKSSFNMALSVQNLTSTEGLNKNINELRADVDRGFDEAKARDLLKSLDHVRQSQGDDEILCLADTRTELLREIHSWIDGKDKGNLFWLSAVDGWGKSTVAATIRNQYIDPNVNASQARQRGAYFFCDRDNKPEGSGNLNRIIPTLAYQLTHAFPGIKAALVEQLDANQDIISWNIENQVRRLISQPLGTLAAPSFGPIVCIIDGLDACADASESSLRALFKSISGSSVLLPPWLKILVTSRPMDFVDDQQKAFRYPSVDIGHPDNRADVSIYIEHRLVAIQKRRNLQSMWPNEKLLKEIDERAGGLFRSAQCILDFIDKNPKDDVDVLVAYLFKARRGTTPSENLRSLYKRTVLWDYNDDEDTRREQRPQKFGSY